jgi:hypothetical protein
MVAAVTDAYAPASRDVLNAIHDVDAIGLVDTEAVEVDAKSA